MTAGQRRFRNETQFREAIVERICDDYRGMALVTSATSAAHRKGQPDVVACVRGRCVQVEAKMPGERPTPAQYAKMRRWQAAGALVGWVTSLAELDELLAHVDDVSWVNPQLAAGVGMRPRIDVGAASVPGVAAVRP